MITMNFTRLHHRRDINVNPSRPLQIIHAMKSSLLILILCSLLIIDPDNFVVAKTAKSQQQTTFLQRPDSSGRPLLMVATYCPNNQNSIESSSVQQYYPQYLEIGSGKWRSNKDSSIATSPLGCPQDKQDILNICKKAYPNHDVRNIVESSRSYKVENWCKINGNPKKRCHSRFTVKPYRCLEGTFQSDALLVPDKCVFDHLHNKTICESSADWNRIASDNCYYKSMKLDSFAMLQPCGLGVFSGVEFVCCPHPVTTTSKELDSKAISGSFEQISHPTSLDSTISSGTNSFAQAATSSSSSSSSMRSQDTPKTINGDDESKDDDDQETWTGSSDDSSNDEDDDDQDEYDDDSSSLPGSQNTNPSPTSSASVTSTSTTTSTTSTTTTTTQRPIDHYLAHFDVSHERDEFRQAEMAVEKTYRDKINSVINNWSQVNGHYEDLKKRDPQKAEQFKKTMTANLERTIQALEEEAENERHQLASMHAERAMVLINRRKKAAMDCLTQALDKDPIRIKQVEKCIVRLLKALEKDREHTFRQYKNLLILNTSQALHQKKLILDHLVTLNRAANQSIEMLHRSPALIDELMGKVVGLWHKMRKIPIDQQIDVALEIKMMEKIEEEVAQRKIKQEREGLNYQNQKVNDKTQSKIKPVEKVMTPEHQGVDNDVGFNRRVPIRSDVNNETIIESSKKPNFEQITTGRQEILEHSQNVTLSAIINDPTIGMDQDSENEIRDHGLIGPKFSHLKADPSQHELTFSIKHDSSANHDKHRWVFSHPILLISLCTIVLTISVMGVKYYKNSTRAYKRQGFAEVGRSCPEEKTVTNLQFNGYENPAYKFFEAEA